MMKRNNLANHRSAMVDFRNYRSFDVTSDLWERNSPSLYTLDISLLSNLVPS
jgi:hypothetical protein